MPRAKVYLLFLIFVFCLYPGTVSAIGINSFQPPDGYLVKKSDSGTESVRFMTDKGDEMLEGKYSYCRYFTNQKKPYSARRVLEHYMSLIERAGGEVVRVDNTSLGGRSFTGKIIVSGVETWISVEVKDLRNYDVSLLERRAADIYTPDSAQNTQAMIEKADAVALLNTVDKTGQLQLDASFRPGSANLRSIPPQFKIIASMMRMDPSYNFRVEAPVDVPAKGNSEERRLLMKARQAVLYDALIASGVPASRLTLEYPAGEAPEEISRARIVLR